MGGRLRIDIDYSKHLPNHKQTKSKKTLKSLWNNLFPSNST